MRKKLIKNIMVIVSPVALMGLLTTSISCAPTNQKEIDVPSEQKMDIIINQKEKTNLNNYFGEELINAGSILEQQLKYNNYKLLSMEAKIILQKVFTFKQEGKDLSWNQAIKDYKVFLSLDPIKSGEPIPAIEIELELQSLNSLNNTKFFKLILDDLGEGKNDLEF